MAILTIREGSKGSAVTVWQSNLSKLGFSTKQDGIFGKDTKAKTISFQKANGLVADGIAGPASQNKMIQVLKDKFPISSGIQSIVSAITPGTQPTATYTTPKPTTTAPKPSVTTSQVTTPTYAITSDEKPKEEDSGFGKILFIGGVIFGGLWLATKADSSTKKKK